MVNNDLVYKKPQDNNIKVIFSDGLYMCCNDNAKNEDTLYIKVF